MRRLHGMVVCALCSVGLGAAFLAWNDVPSEPTAEEVWAAADLMEQANGSWERFSPPSGFDEELDLIFAAQDAVLSAAPIDEGIPLGQRRELDELVETGRGLCYDRSRAIETVLRLFGMRVRHAAIYSTAKTKSAIRSLLKPGVSSHALTEVRTERGWMVVGSNVRWVGLSAEGQVFDLKQVRRCPGVPLSKRVKAPMPDILKRPFTWVYGLYSRHGLFYPPYIPVPDVDWRELLYNLPFLGQASGRSSPPLCGLAPDVASLHGSIG